MLAKGEIPFLRLLLPYSAGILFAWYTQMQPSQLVVFSILFTVFFLFFLRYWVYKKVYRYHYRWLIGIFIHWALFQLAYLNTKVSLFDVQATHVQHAKALLVQVNTEPQIKNGVARFEAQVLQPTTKHMPGKLLFALKLKKDLVCPLYYGDWVFVPATYREVEPPYNPGEFDYKAYLRTHGIRFQAFVHENQIKIYAKNKGNGLVAFALKLRKEVVDAFAKYLQEPEAAAMAATLIMGYRADLSPDLLNTYAQTGTLHILSVSGMHVALVFLLLNFLLKPLDRFPRTKVLKAMVLIGMIWFYALITGFSPSVNRAALMLSFLVLGKTINKGLNTYNLLAISAFILLVYHPMYLFDVGFQLSYLAVLGLVAVHPHVYGLLYIKNKILDAIWSYTSLSISAQVFTFPLSLYIFHQFPVSFLLSNLAVVLPISGVMYVGVAFVFLLPFKLLLAPLSWLLKTLIIFCNSLLFGIAQLPMASVGGLFITMFQLLSLYAIISCFFIAFHTKRKSWFIASMSMFLVYSVHHCYQSIAANDQSSLLFYSLRKNAAMVYLTNEHYVLISDLKATDKTFQFSVNPSLSGIKNGEKYALNEPFRAVEVRSNGQLFQFGSHVVLRWTPKLNKHSFAKRWRVHTLVLSENPAVNLQKILQSVRFDRLLIDATNPDYKIRQWLAEAKNLHLQVHVLKKSPAIRIAL